MGNNLFEKHTRVEDQMTRPFVYCVLILCVGTYHGLAFNKKSLFILPLSTCTNL